MLHRLAVGRNFPFVDELAESVLLEFVSNGCCFACPVEQRSEIDLIPILNENILHRFLGDCSADGSRAYAKELGGFGNGEANIGIFHRCNDSRSLTSYANLSEIIIARGALPLLPTSYCLVLHPVLYTFP